jgi:ABC-type spermidine/putrescine transport system permease subunit I
MRSSRRDPLVGLGGAELALAVLGFVVPVGLLVAYAFGESDYLTFDVSVTGTLDPFRKLFSDVYRPVLLRSLGLSVATVLGSIMIGTPAALAISRLPPRCARITLLAVIAPAFVSFAVRVHAWSNLLGSEGAVEWLTGSRWLFRPEGVAVGMLGVYLPLYVLPVVLALERIDDRVRESAADLGARRLAITRSVVLPLARSGIVTGAVLVGVLAIGEYIVPAVLGGGKVLLLGNVLADQAGGRDQPLGGAIALVVLTTSALGAILVRWASRASARATEGPQRG